MQSIAKGKSGQKSHGNQCEAYFTEHRDDFPMVESSHTFLGTWETKSMLSKNEGPLLSVDDMLVDFATSDIQCMYFYMSSIIP